MKPIKDEKKREKFYRDNPELSYAELAKVFGVKNGEVVRNWAKRHSMPNKRINSQALRNNVPLSELVAEAIKNKKFSITELADRFNVPPKKIRQAINALEEQNIIVEGFENGIQLAKSIRPTEKPFEIDIHKHGEEEFVIGVTADNHIGSKYERLDVLNALYDRFQDYGVKTVYNCGNWIDGEASFNKYEVYVHGVNDQIRNFLEKYPQRKGITTYYITGDDHEGWYVQREHIDIGQYLEDEAHRIGRDDLVNLGYLERDIVYRKGKGQSVIRIIHAGGGSAYATSYTSQKYAESLQGGEKPSIVLVGHYHKFEYGYPREIHILQPGATVDQTPFLRKKRIQTHLGGCVLWIKQNDLGIFTSVKVEWIPFFDKKFYKYHW